MSRTIKLITVFTLAIHLLLLGACTSHSFSSSTTSQYPVWRGEVQILKQLPVPGSYALIGIVKIEGADMTSDERMFTQMKKRAADKGANAVVPQSKIKNQQLSSGGERRVLAAYAIRLRE